MNPASSTTKAATLAGVVMTALWAIFNQFMLVPLGLTLDPPMVSTQNTITVAVVALVAYFKKEEVYPNGAPWVEGQ